MPILKIYFFVLFFALSQPGDVYEGSWNKDGKKHGIGRLKFADGAIYEGKFKDGFFNGVGTLIYADGSKYEGEFICGKYHGFGTYIRSDGMRYEGRFQDGRVNGHGLITHNNGVQGSGQTCEGLFEGNKLTKREVSTDSIAKARQSSLEARKVKLNSGKSKSFDH